VIKALIFDCWGTLFTNSQKPHPFSQFANRLNHTIDDHTFLKAFEHHLMTEEESVAQHIRLLLSDLNIEATTDLVDELRDIMLNSLPTQIPYDDTIETLNRLKNKYRLILLSNSFHEGFTSLQSHYPLNDWFEMVILSYKENIIKPNPLFYDKIIKKTGLEKNELLMIGDNYNDDILAAKEVGIEGILLDRRDRYPDISNKIHTLSELETFLSVNK